MSLTSLINRPCRVIHRVPSGETDEYGREIQGEEIIDTVCELQRVTRRVAEEEAGLYGDLSDTLWKAFFLPGLDLRTADTLIVDGQSYELVGDPWDARNPRTRRPSHIEVTVRRTAADEDTT